MQCLTYSHKKMVERVKLYYHSLVLRNIIDRSRTTTVANIKLGFSRRFLRPDVVNLLWNLLTFCVFNEVFVVLNAFRVAVVIFKTK